MIEKKPHYLARAELQRTDWKLFRAMERQFASTEWCDWRDDLRKLASDPTGFDELPPEPPFGSPPFVAPLGYPDESGPSSEAPPTPLPDLGEKMVDYGDVGSEADWLGVPSWLAAEERDGESIEQRISRLTEAFRTRVNELTNLLLAGTITEDEDRERTLLLAKYNELAELGDRS